LWLVFAEIMVHRRCQADDHRGVQEPLNETMCGCNDIGAESSLILFVCFSRLSRACLGKVIVLPSVEMQNSPTIVAFCVAKTGALPGKMGAHGHEGDGGCDCEGLTMRGSAFLVLDDVAAAHATRRQLVEVLSFPPTLAFAKDKAAAAAALPIKTPSMSGKETVFFLPLLAVVVKMTIYQDRLGTSIEKSHNKESVSAAIAKELPANIKLMTIASNYQGWNDGKLILRLAHMYQVGEHPTLSQPVTFSLTGER
jgi:hypothetical protein